VGLGTESGRASLVDVRSGDEVASAIYPYANGVIARVSRTRARGCRPTGRCTTPADHIWALTAMIPDSVEETKGAAEDVIVLGIDQREVGHPVLRWY
jgi:L-ribulokinase